MKVELTVTVCDDEVHEFIGWVRSALLMAEKDHDQQQKFFDDARASILKWGGYLATKAFEEGREYERKHSQGARQP